MPTTGKRTTWQKIWRITKKIFLWMFILQFVYIIILRWVNPPITMTQLVSWVSGHGMKRDYVRNSSISPYAKLAVISSEDQRFPDHNGFDWKSIQKAMDYNEEHDGKKRRGASTISQQVAKNVFLWQGGGWIRKGLETYFTFMIELFWSKKRILEVYLNVSEMGDGIFGIEMAAQKYFGKPAGKLTQRESAMIAACLPNPKRYKVKPPSPYVLARSQKIMRQMNNLLTDPDVRRVTGLGP
ncbi:MAG TPA: monofunctional biosynthetic peptidoglycan transglycosylase [Chitinophagaceae bacterium]|nr:monofunctional biosynthetic peptidoglycan transglycosylase [Chitinophagaceae bacterium]